MTRIAMVMNRCSCFGVVALILAVALVSAPCLLGTVAAAEEESSEGGATQGSGYDDVPMINLSEELERYYNWSGGSRRRRLDTFVWCVARTNIPDAALQSSLDWVCGTNPDQGQVNCGPINRDGACFLPDTVKNHCDWAFNAYFQRVATPAACDFQGSAQQVTTDPSSGTCVFPGSNLTVISNGTISPLASPGVAAPGPNIFGTGAATHLAAEPHFLTMTATILFLYFFT